MQLNALHILNDQRVNDTLTEAQKILDGLPEGSQTLKIVYPFDTRAEAINAANALLAPNSKAVGFGSEIEPYQPPQTYSQETGGAVLLLSLPLEGQLEVTADTSVRLKAILDVIGEPYHASAAPKYYAKPNKPIWHKVNGNIEPITAGPGTL